MSKKIGVIGAILEDPKTCQKNFNDTVAQFKDIVRGRMGLPFEDSEISVVSIIVLGTLDRINNLTGKLGNIQGVTVKTSISKKEV